MSFLDEEEEQDGAPSRKVRILDAADEQATVPPVGALDAADEQDAVPPMAVGASGAAGEKDYMPPMEARALGAAHDQGDDLPMAAGASGTTYTVTPAFNVGLPSGYTAQDINGLLSGRAWSGTSLTYSFPTSASQYGASYGDPDAKSGFQVLNASQQAAVRYALGLVAQYTNLTFTEITETATTHARLRFAGSSSPVVETSYAYLPGSFDTSGDSWFGNIRNIVATNGSYAFDTVLHEIGHALGLKHGHETFNGFPTLPSAHSNGQFSLMDYHSYANGPTYFTPADGSGHLTYMVNDIAALQHMYGANYSINSGNTVYTWSTSTGQMFVNGVGQHVSSTNTIYQALWDGGGTDTYDLSNYSNNLFLDLNPGAWSTFSQAQLAQLDVSNPSILAVGNVANALLVSGIVTSLIENAIGGSGRDTIVGNAANNTLWGNGGDDILYGMDNTDILIGGAGNDILNGGLGNDTASYSDATGGVTVSLLTTSIQAVGGGLGSDTLSEIENVVGGNFDDFLTGDSNNNILTGGSGGDSLTGGGGDDNLVGGDGNDVLTGGTGNDTLNGGANFDVARFNDATSGVTVSLAVSGAQAVGGGLGNDTLISIENLHGSNFSDALTGDGMDNALNGGDGNDILTGGAGNDRLDGGFGIDTAKYSDATGGVTVSTAVTGTQVVGGGLGIDTLISIENLTGGAFNDHLTGDANANVLFGDAGNDTLSGGAGNDILIGGAGDDNLNGGDGSDTADYTGATSGLTISLSITSAQAVGGGLGSDTLSQIENLQGGDFADTLMGDGNDNILVGGKGDDTLTGGAGNDQLTGGEGIDTVSYADATSSVTVSLTVTGAQSVGGGRGSDTLLEIENILGGGFNDTLTGDASNNILIGGAGNDALSGSIGIDTLSGGTGDDALTGGVGDDNLGGGEGLDTAYYSGLRANYEITALSPTSVRIRDLRAGSPDGTDILSDVERAQFSDQWVALIGATLTGTSGNDILNGTDFGDTFDVAQGGNDTLAGGSGDDTFNLGAAFNAGDMVDGGIGNDTLNLSGNYSGQVVVTALTLRDVETVVLAAGNNYNLKFEGTGSETHILASALGTSNTLTLDGSGSLRAFRATGGAGNDAITGGENTDTLNGGAGDDLLRGGRGNDILMGGDGNDTATYDDATGDVNVSLAENGYDVGGGLGIETLSQIENLDGSDFNDLLEGDGASNAISGGKGNDVLTGGAGNDVLGGGEGTDIARYSGLRANYQITSVQGGIQIVDLRFGSPDGTDLVTDVEFARFGDGVVSLLDAAGITSGIAFTGSSSGQITSGTDFADHFDMSQGGGDTIVGGKGDDIFVFGAELNGDAVDGGEGYDTLTLAGNYSIQTFLTSDIQNVEHISLAASADAYHLVTASGFASGQSTLIDGNRLTNSLIFDGSASSGTFRIRGGTGNDVLTGAAGADSFDLSYGGSDTAIGGDGADTFDLGAAFDAGDRLDGGAGSADALNLSGSYSGTLIITGSMASNIEQIKFGAGYSYSFATSNTFAVGGAVKISATALGAFDRLVFDGHASSTVFEIMSGAGNDTLTGGTAADSIFGGEGLDYIVGDSGADNLDGGGGQDTLVGGAGDDVLTGGEGIDTLYGDADNDVLSGGNANDILLGGAGDDTLDGGADSDTAGYINAASGVTVSLAVTGAQAVGGGLGSDTLIAIENLWGSAYNDILTGDDYSNSLWGNSGDDILTGGAGTDILDGYLGNDTANYDDATGNVSVSLALAGAQNVGGGLGNDTLIGIENLRGGDFSDSLTGDGNANILMGGKGDDTLAGAGGNDTLEGGDGDDLLTGGAGDDILFGGYSSGVDALAGHDILIGGQGDDRLVGSTAVGSMSIASYADATSGITVSLAAGPQSVGGGLGNDTFVDINGLIGSNYNDTLTASTGSISLDGGGGDDTLNLGSGFSSGDRLNGGTGYDTLNLAGDYSSELGITSPMLLGVEKINLAAGNSYNLKFTSAYTSVFSTYIDAAALGASSTFTLDASATSSDFIVTGGRGNNVLAGGTSSDQFIFSGSSGTRMVNGGDGDDLIVFDNTRITSTDRIDGGAGSDNLQLISTDYSSQLIITGAMLSNIERLSLVGGNSYNIKFDSSFTFAGTFAVSATTLYANNLSLDASAASGPLNVESGGGNDVLIGGAGNDNLNVGTGTNIVTGGGGDDTLRGHAGFDTARYSGLANDYEITRLNAENVRVRDLRSGSADGTDTLMRIDRLQWGDGSFLNLFSSPPTITTANVSWAAGRTLALSSLFSTTAGANPIVKYQLRDNTPAALSGHFVVNGVNQAAGGVIEITAAQLSQASFVTGGVSDNLEIRAFDGIDWSAAENASWAPFSVVNINSAPSVTAPNLSRRPNQTVALSSMVSAADADGDTLNYELWDSTAYADSGYFVVNGVRQGVNVAIPVTASQLAQANFVTGSTNDNLWVRASDGKAWSEWVPFGVSPLANNAPVVTPPNLTRRPDQSTALSDMFSVSDADGDTITNYQLWDETAAAASGRFVINGTAQAANTAIDVSAAQLAQTSFVAGIGTDSLRIRAFDGIGWGNWSTFTVSPPVNRAPVATAPNLSRRAGSTIAASDMFSVADADGDAMTRYQLWDSTAHADSGYFVVNGVQQGVNVAIDVLEAQLNQANFVAGTSVDDLWVTAFDGISWSAWVPFKFTPTANAAPVVTTASITRGPNQTIALSSLFTVSDADGDAITKYQLRDMSAGAQSGHFVVNGVDQAAGSVIEITAAQLSQTSFVTGTATDNLQIRAFDGASWSAADSAAWAPFTVTIPPNSAPVVTTANQAQAANQTLGLSTLFTVSDANGDAVTKYQLWDETSDAQSGYFVVNGVAQAANSAIEITQAQLAQTSFVTGAVGDFLQIRAFDGRDWSASDNATWSPFRITVGTANNLPVVTAASPTRGHGKTIALSDLVSVSDADNNTITKYQLQDGSTDSKSGYFVINGVAQAQGTAIEITSSQLAQTSFVTGYASNNFQIRAFDGLDWSARDRAAWTSVSITTTDNVAPEVASANLLRRPDVSTALSAMFTVTDTDGDAMTNYQIWDSTGGSQSGRFMIDGVAQAANTAIDVSAAQLLQTSFVAGSVTDSLRIRAFDGVSWSNWSDFTVTPPVNRAPVITTPNLTRAPGQTIAASDMFTVSDADDDTMTKYELWDSSPDSQSGYFTVNGVSQGVNVAIPVSAAQLNQANFVTGTVGDNLWARAFDGLAWSEWKAFNVSLPVNHVPVVTTFNLTRRPGETVALSDLFSVSDTDSDIITRYQVRDLSVDGQGGYFVINGATQAANTAIDVSAAQLLQTSFVAGSITDTLQIRAFDGIGWSDWSSLTVSPPVNHAPGITTPNLTRTAGQTIAASTMFTVNDTDGDTMTKYELWDSSADAQSGYFTVNGATQGVNVAIPVSAAQLDQASFVTGTKGDSLWARAYDGLAWSEWSNFSVTISGGGGQANRAPVVTTSNLTRAAGQNIALSDMLTVSDPDGDTIIQYQIRDNTAASQSGHFVVNGVAQDANTPVDVSPSQLAQTGFLAGGVADALSVRAYDGQLWSDWSSFNVSPPSSSVNHAPVVTTPNLTRGPGRTIALSDMFTVSDVDGDTITKYEVWDSTAYADSGHFVVNGVTQGFNTGIEVSASQLSQANFVTGNIGDNLWARASDGLIWSDWSSFSVSVAANSAPVVTTPSLTRSANQTIALSDLFTVSDADGDIMAKYELWDSTADAQSGHFVLNSVTQAVNVGIEVSAVQLNQASFVTGSKADSLWVRANDGLVWSTWSPFTVGPA